MQNNSSIDKDIDNIYANEEFILLGSINKSISNEFIGPLPPYLYRPHLKIFSPIDKRIG
jgi:hypothetical protein